MVRDHISRVPAVYRFGHNPLVPVFEYRCASCGRKYRALVGMTAVASVACPTCGSASGDKLVSRFRRGRDEDARIDEIADRLETMGEPEDSATMRETVRELGKAMDEDVSDELEQMLDADLAGESDD